MGQPTLDKSPVMRYLGVFGSPIAHSLSPLLHNAVLQSCHLPYCYGRYELNASAPLRESVARLGLHGCNITLPFKEQAFASADTRSTLAQHIGAVNTLVRSGDGLVGYNTDAPGFLASLLLSEAELPKMPNMRANTPKEPNELALLAPLLHGAKATLPIDSALILGAGGSAKALAIILQLCGVKILVANRSSHAREFFAARGIPYTTLDELDPSAPYSLIINATSASISGELPLGESSLRALFSHAKIAYDLMYGRELPFLRLARSVSRSAPHACGLVCKDGADMLILQAACALMLFCPELAQGGSSICSTANHASDHTGDNAIKRVFAIMHSVFPR